MKAAIQEKDNEFKRLEEERLQKEQDAQQLKLQEQKETEEKEKLRIAEEDAKKKQLTYLLKNNYPWIIIAFLFFLNVFSWISNRSSSVNDTNASKSEYTKLVNAHKSDSINIKNLTDEVKSLKDVNNKLKKDISIHQKREKYIELYPTAYRNMMKIK